MPVQAQPGLSNAALRESAAHWRATGRPAIEVRVVAARGSVPREAGTRMLVAADAVLGTVGGGHLELEAIAEARRRLSIRRAGSSADAGLDLGEQVYPLGPRLGQCCGGTVTLGFRPFDDQAFAQWSQAVPRFRLQLYGAGHVGRAIARVLDDIDCSVRWIDARDSEFPYQPSAAHIERVCAEPVEAEVAEARPGDFHLVLTHSHALDLAISEAILRRADFGYFGLIGSATKRARFLHRFEQRGLPPEAIARITCPIGLPGIAGKEPAVIAVAVVAQLLQQAG